MRNALILTLALAVAAQAAVRKELFNHKDIKDWKVIPRHAGDPAGSKPSFEVVAGNLQTTGEKGDIWYTREKIGNAKLRVVFKMSNEQGNSGVFTRIPVEPVSEDDAINKGIEVQIDNRDDDFHCTGVLYSMTKAKARPSKPAGEWNTMDIYMMGPRTVVYVNDVLVTDYDGVSPVPEKKKSYEPDRGRRSDTGYIAVQSHDNSAVITFREISVEPLTAKDRTALEAKLAK
jgi:hypothetical protein